MIRLAWITAAIVLLGLMILPIFYPPAQLPYHYYMDGPNYYIPTTIDTSNYANIDKIDYLYLPELCECGNDPSYFIRKYCVIQHPIRGKIPFEL